MNRRLIVVLCIAWVWFVCADMGGFIVVSGQPSASGSTDDAPVDAPDDSSSSPPQAAVIGGLLGAVIALALSGLCVYAGVNARRKGYWYGCCKFNLNPNLGPVADSGAPPASSSAVVEIGHAPLKEEPIATVSPATTGSNAV